MKIIKYISIIILVFYYCNSFGQDMAIYNFVSNAQQSQFNQLTNQLRCLVCQNENLANSNASLAIDIRAQIAAMIIKGYSSTEILSYLVSRYGNYILYKPPVMKITWLLWFSPPILLIIGLGILYFAIFRQRKYKHDEISAIEKQKIQKFLSLME